MGNLILDTGPAVALISQDDQDHEACARFFKDFDGRLFSTEPVLTEAVYLLSRLDHKKKCLQLFANSAQLVPSSVESLGRIENLMDKYQDTPMDFADATLVALAEELVCGEIFTLDRRGFETYRWGRNRTFKIYPESRS